MTFKEIRELLEVSRTLTEAEEKAALTPSHVQALESIIEMAQANNELLNIVERSLDRGYFKGIWDAFWGN